MIIVWKGGVPRGDVLAGAPSTKPAATLRKIGKKRFVKRNAPNTFENIVSNWCGRFGKPPGKQSKFGKEANFTVSNFRISYDTLLQEGIDILLSTQGKVP